METIKKFFISTAPLLAMTICLPSYANDQTCSNEIRNSIVSTQKQSVRAISCKALPNEPDKTVVSYIIERQDTARKKERSIDDLPVLAWETLLIDSSSHKILKRSDDTVAEDAGTRVGESSIWIDTAAYMLKSGTRAFGIRLDIGHSPSCADGGVSQYLTLFIEENKQLRPILKSLPMSYWYIRENNYCGSAPQSKSKQTVIETLKPYIRIEKSVTNGFHDISIIGIAESKTYNVNGNDVFLSKRTIKQKISYNGKVYPIKQWDTLLNKKW